MDWLIELHQESPTWAVAVATAAKIAFVLVIVLTFAPLLVWAERRQSAMIQDRIGPVRAGLQLPSGLTAVLGNQRAAAAIAIVLGVLMVMAFAFQEPLRQWYTGESASPDAAGGFQMLFVVGPVLGFAVGVLGMGAAGYINRTNGNITLGGLLHPLADALKFVFKEDFVPPKADKVLHALAPILTVVTAIATFAVIPFAGTVYLGYLGESLPRDGFVDGPAIAMQVASLNVGVLFIFAVAGTGVIGAAIAGYSSDNKYALLGGLRAASQMVSYEVTLGLTLVPAFMVYGTLLLDEMVQWQADHVWGVFVFPVMTLAAILFFAASIAETKRIPFDLPESESELVAGYFTEYSGMKFGMFFMGEFIEVVVLSAILSTLFLGGYDLPFLHRGGLEAFGYLVPMPHWAVVVAQMLTFVAKLAFLVWLQLMIRWTLPRFRYDQLMSVCWKLILPISLANILATGVLILLTSG